MSKSKFTAEVEQLNKIANFSESNWNSINPEYAARMRLQNQFKADCRQNVLLNQRCAHIRNCEIGLL